MIASILAEVRSLGVSITAPAADRLKLVADSGDVPPRAVEIAREHKAALLATLRPSDAIHFPDSMIDCQHAWRDTAESDGRTRRFCSSCGRFGGFVLADGSVSDVPPEVAR